ncbi:MAG TPA: hypothetical protein VL688_05370 [Verrucomicrobiae bacterium]|nr:hypothetical protein [Verrucomicrobiae bacterium]
MPYTLEASALEKSLKDFVQETGCGELFVAASRGLPQKFLKDVLPAALQQLKADRLDLDFHYLPPR